MASLHKPSLHHLSKGHQLGNFSPEPEITIILDNFLEYEYVKGFVVGGKRHKEQSLLIVYRSCENFFYFT